MQCRHGKKSECTLPGYIRHPDTMFSDGPEVELVSILFFLMRNNFDSLLCFAEDIGYVQDSNGYFSNCHLCADIRKHLSNMGDFTELKPSYFYEAIDSDLQQ